MTCYSTFGIATLLWLAHLPLASESCRQEYNQKLQRIESEAGEELKQAQQEYRRLAEEFKALKDSKERSEELRRQINIVKGKMAQLKEQKQKQRKAAEQEYQECKAKAAAERPQGQEKPAKRKQE